MSYRPGWFPEYNPKEQKVFDHIQDVIREVFEQRNFDHIWTPAVEKNEILLKWWDNVANEIFGLHGMKDFESSNTSEQYQKTKKDYSLHFDLTIPFARYTLDHLNELTLPFKRYQMQPVWRGERQQRWRFKEFWQCDVDSIWRSGTDVWYWYGVETIATLQYAIKSVFEKSNLSQRFVSHVSHIWVTKSWLSYLLHGDNSKIESVISLFDKYHKRSHEEFMKDLMLLVENSVAASIETVILSQSHQDLSSVSWYELLNNTITSLNQLWCSVVFDVTIVRWLSYYTDVVFETFIEWEQSLWSVCSGGWYQDFTNFIDPKQSFSGIGWSIGLSRLMEIINSWEITTSKESYMIIHFEDTISPSIDLYGKLLSENKTCELYPSPVKLGKQFEYADKKWITHCVIMGPGELEQWIYKIKNLSSGEEEIVKLSSWY